MENRRQERGREDPCYLFPDFPKTATDKIRETRGKRLSQNTLQEPQQKKYCQSPRAGEKSEDGKREARKKSAAQRLRAAVTHFIFFLLRSSPKKGISHRATVPPRNTQRERERPRERDPERHTPDHIIRTTHHTSLLSFPLQNTTETGAARYCSHSLGVLGTAGKPEYQIPPHPSHTQKHRNTQRNTQRERKRKVQKIARTHKNAQKPSPRFVVRALHKQMTHNIASVRTDAGAPR